MIGLCEIGVVVFSDAMALLSGIVSYPFYNYVSDTGTGKSSNRLTARSTAHRPCSDAGMITNLQILRAIAAAGPLVG